MKFVFGPVPSRRLGQSLGVDPIPLKTCNWNCVYCQLGRTTPLTNARGEFFPRQEIFAEIQRSLQQLPPGRADWVTFVGSGETCLYSGLGWLIRQVKQITSLPVAVITNGSLLYLPEVRRELQTADAVLPSLDAGDAALYRRINRPLPRLTFERLVAGLIAFRREYSGRLWVEVMLLKGMNDSQPALEAIAKTLNSIHPDQIHISLPTRPPAEPWVLPAENDRLQAALAILGEVAHIVPPEGGYLGLDSQDDLPQALLGILTRHPMGEQELIAALERRAPGASRQLLQQLAESGQVKVVERYGKRFWSAARTRHPQVGLERNNRQKRP